MDRAGPAGFRRACPGGDSVQHALVCFAAVTFLLGTPAVASPSRGEISVEAPRPLAAALEVLEKRHGLVISYEDPPYFSSEDVVDVTEAVRGDRDEPRLLVPRSGVIEISYAVTEQGHPVDPASTIQALLDEHARQGNPGRFRVDVEGDRYFVVPTEVLDASGHWIEVAPVLDTRVTLEHADRGFSELLKALLEAIAAGSGAALGQGLFILRKPLRATSGADGETARRVLTDLLESLGKPGQKRYVWKLFYDPGLRKYFLNLNWIAPPGSGGPGS